MNSSHYSKEKTERFGNFIAAKTGGMAVGCQCRSCRRHIAGAGPTNAPDRPDAIFLSSALVNIASIRFMVPQKNRDF